MKQVIWFFFDWGADTCLWNDDDGALDYDKFNLSEDLKNTLINMAKEYQTALNWDYPPDPSPWTAEQKEDFMNRSKIVYQQIVNELGEKFEVLFQFEIYE